MKAAVTTDRPWFNDTAFQLYLLSASIHHWLTVMSVMSAVKQHWLTFICWLGLSAAVCFICKHCSAKCSSVYCECWKLGTAFFSIWSGSEDLTSVLHSFARVEFYYIRCRQGQGSLNYNSTVIFLHSTVGMKWPRIGEVMILLRSYQLNLILGMYTKSAEWFIWSIFLTSIFNGRQKLFVSCIGTLLTTIINRYFQYGNV